MILLLGQWGILSAIFAPLLLGGSVAAGRYLNRAHGAGLEQAAREAADRTSRLRELCARGLPVWAQQIQTSRESADGAMTSLTRNFGDMVEHLGATLSASKVTVRSEEGREEDAVMIINGGEAQLARVIGVLQELHRSKESILEQVRGYASSLQEMAADVRQIALQIRLLALNGAIEASRAGEAGKAFAVVVGEMRQLSGQSAEMGDRISKKVDAVNHSLAGMFGDGTSTDAEASSIQKAERDILSVIARFKDLTQGLSQSVHGMETEGKALRERISEALVDFQFQDRISQILSHAAQGMAQLGVLAERREEETLSLEDWLAGMAESFTTHEEFANLQGKARGASAEHEVTYF